MSQPQSTPSNSRTALVVAVIALVLAAAGLGYTAYLGVFSIPNQFSTFPSVNERFQTWNITIDWATYNSGKDRFSPQYITIAQGDTVNLQFMSNDTGDGHTFTVRLPTTGSGSFQLNNSMAGLRNFLTGNLFTGAATGCSDQNGSPVTCKTSGTIGNLTATGSFTIATPGLYRFRCVYHEKLGMFGFLVVLPNTSTT